MPSEDKTKRFQFNLNMNKKEDQELFIWLQDESKGNYSGFIKELLEKSMKGTLETSLDLKDEKLRVDIEFKKICTLIKQKELLHWDIFKKTPSYLASKAIKTNVQNSIGKISCYDEKNNRIMCPECGSCFVHSLDKKDIAESKELFIDHYFKQHNENLPVDLVEELQTF